MDETDANSGLETSFKRVRTVITLAWVAKAAGLALVGFSFWAGALFLVISWALDASVFPKRPTPDSRDHRLKWALLGFGIVFLCGWIVGMLWPSWSGFNPVLLVGLIGIIICESSRYLRADIEYLRKRRESETQTEPMETTPQDSHPLIETKSPVQEELPL